MADSDRTPGYYKPTDNLNEDDSSISYEEKRQMLGDMYIWTDEVCKNFGASGALEVSIRIFLYQFFNFLKK